MKFFLTTLLLIQGLMGFQFAHADAADEKRWIKELVSEDVSLVRRAATEAHNAGVKSTAVLDVMAEVILETYDIPPTGFIHADSLAWCTNAIGASGNGRYRDVLKEVEKNANHKKLRKFAKKNRKKLKESEAAQYKKGGVSLSKLRK